MRTFSTPDRFICNAQDKCVWRECTRTTKANVMQAYILHTKRIGKTTTKFKYQILVIRV